jgi:hypothetical protein
MVANFMYVKRGGLIAHHCQRLMNKVTSRMIITKKPPMIYV